MRYGKILTREYKLETAQIGVMCQLKIKVSKKYRGKRVNGDQIIPLEFIMDFY